MCVCDFFKQILDCKKLNIRIELVTRLAYQQRIALKGQEGTIAHFTNLLRDIKKATSVNSAETIESAIEFWTSYGCSKPASDPSVCFMQRSQFYCPSR